MRFFVDNNLSQRLASGLAAFGEDVVHLKEYFDEDEVDPVWLKEIGDAGWFLVSRDERVRWRPAELQAIREHKVGGFLLGGKNRSRCELIQQAVRNWPRMKTIAKRERRPFLYRIPPRGTKFKKIGLS